MDFRKIIPNRELEWALRRNADVDPTKRQPVPIWQGVQDCMRLINATDAQYTYFNDRLHLFCRYGSDTDVAPLFAKADLHDVIGEFEGYYDTAGYALLIQQLCEYAALMTTVYTDGNLPKKRFSTDKQRLLAAIDKIMRI